MMPPPARPKLASKAKLRLDPKTGRHVLLYPEKGLALNPTGAAILELCKGELTVDEIVERLGGTYTRGASPETIRAEVESFLRSLAERGLVEGFST